MLNNLIYDVFGDPYMRKEDKRPTFISKINKRLNYHQ